jgi:hypothetical protein
MNQEMPATLLDEDELREKAPTFAKAADTSGIAGSPGAERAGGEILPVAPTPPRPVVSTPHALERHRRLRSHFFKRFKRGSAGEREFLRTHEDLGPELVRRYGLRPIGERTLLGLAALTGAHEDLAQALDNLRRHAHSPARVSWQMLVHRLRPEEIARIAAEIVPGASVERAVEVFLAIRRERAARAQERPGAILRRIRTLWTKGDPALVGANGWAIEGPSDRASAVSVITVEVLADLRRSAPRRHPRRRRSLRAMSPTSRRVHRVLVLRDAEAEVQPLGAPGVMLAPLAPLATPAIPAEAGYSGPPPARARRTFGGCEEDAVQRAGIVDTRWTERPAAKDFVGPSRRSPRERDRSPPSRSGSRGSFASMGGAVGGPVFQGETHPPAKEKIRERHGRRSTVLPEATVELHADRRRGCVAPRRCAPARSCAPAGTHWDANEVLLKMEARS